MESVRAVLAQVPRRVIACSGGVDSLLLATLAHRAAPDGTVVAHDVTPAVPAAATARVLDHARTERWHLELVRSAEFDDERYLANPRDRCYHCKSHLYDTLDDLAARIGLPDATVLSGANTDDLGEYRPGLRAAAEHGVRHPFVEAGVGKDRIRSAARALGLPFAELPAAPCLASRLYTGTRVTPARLRAVEVGEELLRSRTGILVLRCRLRGDQVLIEVGDGDRHLIDTAVLDAVGTAMRLVEPEISGITLDENAYRPGRAFLPLAAS